MQQLRLHLLKALCSPIASGYAAFFVLLLFSILFHLERACYADIAFQVFEIINTKNVAYQLDRFGAVLIQVFPLVAVLLELPLKYVLLGYSAALVAQNFFFFWLLHKVLRQKEIALALALFNVLLVTETFFWATNEVKQGFSFSILFAGIIRSFPLENFQGVRRFGLLLLYFTILTITLFLHPVVVAAAIFVVAYTAVHSGKYFSKTTLASAGIIAIILGGKYLFLPVASYDAEQLSLRENFISYFPHYFALPSFENFLRWCIKDWYLYALLVFAVHGYYLWKREWLKLALQVAFTAGFLLIVNVTHPHTEKVFIECYYQALAVFILFPFVFELLPALRGRSVLILLSAIFFLRLNTIFHTQHKYRNRLNQVREVLASTPGKFVLPLEAYPAQSGMMTWGIPYESVLLTSLQSPDSCRSFAVLRDISTVQRGERLVYTVFGKVDYANLNPVYFRPKAQPYRIISAAAVSAE